MHRLISAGAALLFVAMLFASTGASAQIPGLSFPAAAQEPAAAESPAAADPSLDDLIRLLENDDTRQKLVESLKAAAYKSPAAAAGAGAAAPADSPESLSVPGEIARASQILVGQGFALAGQVAVSVREAESLLSGASAVHLPRLYDAILPVVLVALIVFAIYAILSAIRHRIADRLEKRAEHAGPLAKLGLLLLLTGASLLAILISLAAGYATAILFFGGPPNINQALFLNAFLFIEVTKGLFHVFVAPDQPKLRLTPFGDRHARYWYFWISRLISVLGYSFLFVAPVVEASSNAAAGDAVRFIVAFLSLCTVIFLILRNRATVRDRLGRQRARGDRSFRARFYSLLGHVWWIFAIVFVLALFSVWLSSPDEGLRFMTVATLKSIAAMACGGLVVSILTKIIVKGIPVPDRIRDRLPLLERRVNSFIPNALTIIRVLVVIVVLAFIMEAWSLFDLGGWAATEVGQSIIGGTIGAGAVIMLGFAAFLAVSSWIEYRLNPNFGSVPTARERTLLSLLRNAFTILLLAMTVMLVLSQIGINIAPLLAGAGVVGLAIGFGAQKLVQDVITGAFIQFENAMNEGDVVLVAGVSGVVERLTIRSVGLRALDGTYHLIPFSSVDQVANMTKDFSQFVADLGVAYRENTDDVKRLMQDAFDELKAGDLGADIIADFEMFGVNELGASAVVVRGRIKTLPGKQWGVGRAYNEIVKRLCDERSVEIPFPHMTVWFGEDKGGNAPPVHLAAPLVAADPTQVGRQISRSSPSRYGSVNADGSPIPPSVHDIDDAADGDEGR
ncbi:mechanosensitive ion channel protein MscS [Aureimonas sp. SA4125]|uniref:mechanosensitive ion channel domain-containing protein n=1 Tax=Aureimonas sp. SA4125 TaxID=2826993 RepID=UPI001CC622FD|nr:mechanosensitive ion channel domain-containing protein [Aureimonas sp. SA4125]BDA84362.1 mechanosensitive ion channel protein MscS [Aureimonas sp. SA4125]